MSIQVASSTDSQATVKAAADGTLEPVNYELPETEDDGRFRSDAVESDISSRNQLLARLEELERAEKEELASLEPLTPEAAEAQKAVLAEMEAAGEQQAEAQPLTEAELGQIRAQAVQDAIRAGRRAAGFDAQVLEAEYGQVQQAVIADYDKKLEQTKARHSDFDAVIAEVAKNDIPLTQAVTEAIVTIGGPELVYRLAKAPSKARELAALPDHVAVAKIGQMAAELNVRPQPARQQSNLRPTKAVGNGNFRNGPSISDPDIPYSEFYKLREKQQKERYRR